MTTISNNNNIAQAIYLGSKDKKGHELNLYAKEAVKFLNKKRLLSKAENILIKLNEIVDKEEKIVPATVASANKLSPHAKHDLMRILAKRYNAKEVELSEILDERLLGGLKVEVGGELIDLTLRNRINKLKEYLIEKA